MQVKVPLQWPQGWPRTQERKDGRFGTGDRLNGASYVSYRSIGIADAIKRVLTEIARLKVASPIISTNLMLRRDGLPYGDQREPADPGVAVYWQTKDGKTKVMAIDRYKRAADNLAAIAATLEAMRAIERHGGAVIMERAFTGFTALPAPKTWQDILELAGRHRLTPHDIEAAFKRLAKEHHPDHGGDSARMAEIAAARDEALKAIQP